MVCSDCIQMINFSLSGFNFAWEGFPPFNIYFPHIVVDAVQELRLLVVVLSNDIVSFQFFPTV